MNNFSLVWKAGVKAGVVCLPVLAICSEFPLDDERGSSLLKLDFAAFLEWNVLIFSCWTVRLSDSRLVHIGILPVQSHMNECWRVGGCHWIQCCILGKCSATWPDLQPFRLVLFALRRPVGSKGSCRVDGTLLCSKEKALPRPREGFLTVLQALPGSSRLGYKALHLWSLYAY